MSIKDEAELSNHAIAREWWPGLGLELSGVQLGDDLEYDILRVAGSIWKRYLDEMAAQADSVTETHD